MTLTISQSDQDLTNSVTVSGTPAVLITGNNVRFTNSDSGRIISSATGQPALQIDGSGATIVNAHDGIIRVGTGDYAGTGIQGSIFADIIENQGLIGGNVKLGEGNDVFRQAGNVQGIIYMGGGNDRLEVSGTGSTTADGGTGIDTLVLNGGGNTSGTGFEHLIVSANPGGYNLSGYSGFQSITLGAGGSYGIQQSLNPNLDLSLSGGWLTIGFDSSFARVIGGVGAEWLELTNGGRIKSADLGGGDDTFTLNWSDYYYNTNAPVIEGLIDGGSGYNRLQISVDGNRTVDLAGFVGFSELNTGTYTSATSDVTLTHANGYALIYADSDGDLVLDQSQSASARLVGGILGTVTLTATTVIGQVGFGPNATIPDYADDRLSMTVINRGSILGAVDLYIGDDLYDGSAGTTGGTIRGFAGNDTLRSGAGNDRIEGGSGADLIDGGANDDVLDGGNGSDTIYGGSGSDSIYGGAGVDILYGGTGNDYYVVDALNEQVIEAVGEGTDFVFAAGNFVLTAGSEVEVLAAYDQSSTAALNLTGNAFANRIVGSAGDNVLDGAGGNDAIEGGAGSDSIYGGGGNDTLYGGTGNDYYVVDGGDLAYELAGQGTDFVFATANHALSAGSEVEILAAYDQAATFTLNLTGNEFANRIVGNAGDNVLDGAGGNDQIEGGGGSDSIYGGTGSDTIYGGAGNDYIVVDGNDVVREFAGEGMDIVFATADHTLAAGSAVEVLAAYDQGATGALNLTGNELANRIVGNAGANVINGGLGSDELWGQGGADSFLFSTAPGSNNVDLIGDFATGVDKLLLDHGVFASVNAGALTAAAFVVGSQAADANDYFIYNSQTGALYYDADGAGGVGQVQFAQLQAGLALTSTNFLIV